MWWFCLNIILDKRKKLEQLNKLTLSAYSCTQKSNGVKPNHRVHSTTRTTSKTNTRNNPTEMFSPPRVHEAPRGVQVRAVLIPKLFCTRTGARPSLEVTGQKKQRSAIDPSCWAIVANDSKRYCSDTVGTSFFTAGANFTFITR